MDVGFGDGGIGSGHLSVFDALVFCQEEQMAIDGLPGNTGNLAYQTLEGGKTGGLFPATGKSAECLGILEIKGQFTKGIPRKLLEDGKPKDLISTETLSTRCLGGSRNHLIGNELAKAWVRIQKVGNCPMFLLDGMLGEEVENGSLLICFWSQENAPFFG